MPVTIAGVYTFAPHPTPLSPRTMVDSVIMQDLGMVIMYYAMYTGQTECGWRSRNNAGGAEYKWIYLNNSAFESDGRQKTAIKKIRPITATSRCLTVHVRLTLGRQQNDGIPGRAGTTEFEQPASRFAVVVTPRRAH